MYIIELKLRSTNGEWDGIKTLSGELKLNPGAENNKSGRKIGSKPLNLHLV